MFSFLSIGRKDPKKSNVTPEKETDGDFVIVGETAAEQRWGTKRTHASHPSTNVIVRPPLYPSLPPHLVEPKRAAPAVPVVAAGPPVPPATTDINASAPDFLGDVPFTLAPHLLAMQTRFPLNSEPILSRDVNYNLTSFNYDFTLENSVLCDL